MMKEEKQNNGSDFVIYAPYFEFIQDLIEDLEDNKVN